MSPTGSIDRSPSLPLVCGAPGSALPTGSRLGEFRVAHFHGTAALCEIYTVIDIRDGSSHSARVVRPAVFVARPDIAASLFLAGRSLSGLRHPNLVPVLGAGWTDEAKRRPYLALERASGRDLITYLASHGSVDAALLTSLASQSAAALAALHRNGVAHANLHPESITLTRIGDDVRVQLTGFEHVQAISLGASALEEPLVAADLAALGVLLRDLDPGGAHTPPGLARVIARLVDPAPGTALASAAEVCVALAASQVLRALTDEAAPSPPVSERPFGEVSLLMSHDATHTTSRIAMPGWALGLLLCFTAALVWSTLALHSPAPALATKTIAAPPPVLVPAPTILPVSGTPPNSPPQPNMIVATIPASPEPKSAARSSSPRRRPSPALTAQKTSLPQPEDASAVLPSIRDPELPAPAPLAPPKLAEESPTHADNKDVLLPMPKPSGDKPQDPFLRTTI